MVLGAILLYIIFSDPYGTKNVKAVIPSPQISQSVRQKDLEVAVVAKPPELKAPAKETAANPEDIPTTNLEVTYYNNSESNLTGFQIQILNGQTLKYKTGSSLTAKFNKQDTAANKRATYDVTAARSGASNTASIQIQAFEPGVYDFRALVTTKEGKTATSVPITVTVQ